MGHDGGASRICLLPRVSKAVGVDEIVSQELDTQWSYIYSPVPSITPVPRSLSFMGPSDVRSPFSERRQG